jgi:transcriptional regulator with XRE-family HTH domain
LGLPSESAVVKALGTRIRDLRDAKGWSRERLAEAAYLDRSYLAGIERGLRNPSVRSLLKIANALKVQVGSVCRRVIGYHAKYQLLDVRTNSQTNK